MYRNRSMCGGFTVCMRNITTLDVLILLYDERSVRLLFGDGKIAEF